jgi:hypothetical protein
MLKCLEDFLRVELARLKDAASPKQYEDMPQDVSHVAGYLFTCCIENGYLVLGVSLTKETPDVPHEILVSTITTVFGKPEVVWNAFYTMRGHTTLYTWKILEATGV